MSEQFKREIRYNVIKLKTGLPVECVVVEDDWHPEYEIVWQMIQDRVEGRPNFVEALRLESEAYRVAWQNAQARVEALEAERKELEKQEPVCYLKEEWLHYEQGSNLTPGAFPVYARPVPAPDLVSLVAELIARGEHEAAASINAEEQRAENFEAELATMKHRAEDAEAKLKAAEEQEPVPADYVFCPEYDETPSGMVQTGGAYIPANPLEIKDGLSCKLYARPVPAPDLQKRYEWLLDKLYIASAGELQMSKTVYVKNDECVPITGRALDGVIAEAISKEVRT